MSAFVSQIPTQRFVFRFLSPAFFAAADSAPQKAKLDKPVFTCEHCGESYATEKYKNDHESNCAANPERAKPKSVCKKCSKPSTNKANLKRHENTCIVRVTFRLFVRRLNRPNLFSVVQGELKCHGCGKVYKRAPAFATHEAECPKVLALPQSVASSSSSRTTITATTSNSSNPSTSGSSSSSTSKSTSKSNAKASSWKGKEKQK
ncbi:hypothetical protein P7C70_g2396, partial [Phenoliferia sp. Uapishka_3]